MRRTQDAELARVAASPDSLPLRARALLEALLDALYPPARCAAAGLDLADPVADQCVSIAEVGAGLGPAPWVLALHAPDGRHVGHLRVRFHDGRPPSPTVRRRLVALAPVLASGIDPVPSLLSTAGLVAGVSAGRALRRDGRTQQLPGLGDDPLLRSGSPVVSIAGGRLGDHAHVSSSFLWPRDGWHAPGGHARVTVVAAPRDVAATGLTGMALLSPSPDLHDLTPRELEVLGLMIDGLSNQEIARTLVVAPRTVAAHVEHLLPKLDAMTRTLAAVRAERRGLYVPAVAHSYVGERGARRVSLPGGGTPPRQPSRQED